MNEDFYQFIYYFSLPILPRSCSFTAVDPTIFIVYLNTLRFSTANIGSGKIFLILMLLFTIVSKCLEYFNFSPNLNCGLFPDSYGSEFSLTDELGDMLNLRSWSDWFHGDFTMLEIGPSSMCNSFPTLCPHPNLGVFQKWLWNMYCWSIFKLHLNSRKFVSWGIVSWENYNITLVVQ